MGRLVWALLPLALCAWDPCGAWEVPPPTNVIVESYNFNTSVSWDYKNVSLEPLFTVLIHCYRDEITYVADTCVNISQRYCDLTYKMSESCAKTFYAKVKAVAGSHESLYAVYKHEIFQNGRIGPPKLNLTLQKDEINVLIEDPLTPYFEDNYPLSVRENITDFSYQVYMRPAGSSEKDGPFDVDFENKCGKWSCTINLPVPNPDIGYCVSARGISELDFIFGEESKESCIVPTKHSLDLTGLIIGCSLAAVALTGILAVVAVCICLKYHNVTLPKSLATVVRSINPTEIKPEHQYEVSIYKPIMSKFEDNNLIENIDAIEELQTTDLIECGKEVNTGDSKRPSSEMGEISVPNGTAVEIPESEHSLEANDNYSKSVSGQEEPCNLLPSLDRPIADMRQPTNTGRCTVPSGYDKPHWGDPNSEGEAALVV